MRSRQDVDAGIPGRPPHRGQLRRHTTAGPRAHLSGPACGRSCSPVAVRAVCWATRVPWTA